MATLTACQPTCGVTNWLKLTKILCVCVLQMDSDPTTFGRYALVSVSTKLTCQRLTVKEPITHSLPKCQHLPFWIVSTSFVAKCIAAKPHFAGDWQTKSNRPIHRFPSDIEVVQLGKNIFGDIACHIGKSKLTACIRIGE